MARRGSAGRGSWQRWLIGALLLLAVFPQPASLRAQDASCRPDVEPNNLEAEAEPVEGAFCIAGDLPDASDQDLFLWTVSETEAKSLWAVTVDGPAGAVTSAKVFSLASEPGAEPILVEQQIAEVNKDQAATAPGGDEFLFAPGQYLVGISRTDTLEGLPATTTYRLQFAKSARLPKRLDKEPNDDTTTATPLEGEIAIAGDLGQSYDYYTWTLSEDDAASGWELHAQGTLGDSLNLNISRQDGTQLLYASADDSGRIDLYDLVFAAGTYYLQVTPQSDHASPYLLRMTMAERPATDLEPNNDPANASPIDLANPVLKGRLAAESDIDRYRLVVDQNLAGSLFDVRLLTKSPIERQICLTTIDTNTDLQCKRGDGGASLSNILLPRGEYLITVSGATAPDDLYILRIDPTSVPSPVFEAEPNDNEEFGSALDPTRPISGRFDGSETDVFRFATEGDPQLWDIAISGAGIEQLDLSRRDGTTLASARIDGENSGGTLYDMYLTPGDHWLRTRGTGGDYQITLTPRGAPPPDGEHEANNQVVLAEPMLLGDSKSGRVVDSEDADVFRFSLAAREHVRVDLDAPDDAQYRMALGWGTDQISAQSAAEPGDSLEMDLILLPGDYVLTIAANQPSLDRYSLRVLRDDPFQLSDDQEPNDDPATAQLLVSGTEIQGELTAGDDQDVYLVAAAADRDLEFWIDGETISPSLSDGETTYDLSQAADDGPYTVDQRITDDLPLYLVIGGSGTYRLTYGEADVADSPRLPSFVAADDTPPLAMSLALDNSEIAAYWSEAQIVDGALTISNTGAETVDFLLVAATSHFAFAVEIDDVPVSIEPGATLTVPISVQIEPDTWANIPVRITLAAETSDRYVTTWAEITPTADAPLANPHQAWPAPAPLLGGLDLASPALGAVVAGTIDAEREAFLHDGVAPVGSGFALSSPTLPLELTVDLAGDQAAPVAGILLNPQTVDGFPHEQVRDFEFQLSSDGVTFTTALTGTLSPILREQYFVLPEPVTATHARLIILSGYDPNPTRPGLISLGEWGVIGQPGFVPATIDRINIADWSFGGHVVRANPQMSTPDKAVSVLTPDDRRETDYPGDAAAIDWVIGFNDNRAALIIEINWVDPLDTDPATRLTEVEVQVSMGSPSGPWQSVGQWTLRRAENGNVRKFRPDEPIWARYVRLIGNPPEASSTLEYPAQIAIYEAPIGEDYLSVIGTWGSTNPAGYFELQNPPEPDTAIEDTDAPDEQAQAAPLEVGKPVNGRSQIGKDVDWYRVTAPERDNTLTFTLTGQPAVDVVIRMFDDDGRPVETHRSVSGDTSTVTYTATVTPGAEYTIEVSQPAHSIVFTFDTSGSMGNYAPLVQQSLRSFAGGVTKGEEFVQVMAFEAEPILETWTDDSYLVYAAINGYYDQTASSAAESAIYDSTRLLSEQEGSTAILIITDAETGYTEATEMWEALDVTQPRIFAVHVGGSSTPVQNEHLMEDWSSNGGFYQYTTNQAEMDRAFDRAATWLRRPAAYGLTVTSTQVEEPTPAPTPTEAPPAPGTLAVLPAPESAGNEPAAQVSTQVTIEIVLDTSGSMLAAMPDGQRRIDVARNVLTDLVNSRLPARVPVSLRVFGNQPDSCETSLLVPVQPLDPATMAGTIQAIEPVNLVKTPLGASLDQVAKDLAGVEGPKIVVLVTDGEETCGGDAAASIQRLIDQGIDVQVNIVGFALDDEGLRNQFRDWAQIGNGSYFDATNAAELAQAIARAVQAPFRVLDANGDVVASGTVGGDPVELPPGTYMVVVLTDPEQRFEEVVVEPDGSVELKLPAP
jgi:hypothetical protein